MRKLSFMITGMILFCSFSSNAQQTNIDLQHLNQGVYFLRISSKMGDVVKKIAIK